MHEQVRQPSSEFKFVGTRPSVPTASTRSPAAPCSAPTSTCPACCSARCCAARTRMRASGRSTPRKAEALPGVKAVVTGDGLPRAARPRRPDRREAGEPPRPGAQLHGARQGAVRGPRRRRGRRHQRRRSPRQALDADRGRLRGAAARHRRRRGDGSPTRRCCTTTCSPRASSRSRAKPSNIAKRIEFEHGRRRGGLQRGRRGRRARVTPPGRCTRATSSRTPALASASEDGQVRGLGVDARATSWCAPTAPSCSASRHRARSASRRPRSAAASAARPWSTSSRWRSRCRRSRGRPVKMVMTREEVFRATGPTSGAHVDVKIGAKKDGTHRRRRGGAEVPGRRLPGLAGRPGCMCAFACYDLDERRGRRLRRGEQPAEGRGLSRARRADRRVRGRERDRRAGAASSAWTRSSCA